MENKDWINDYVSLKQVSNANPFTVPAGYFNDLGDRIVSRKNIEGLKNDDTSGGFTVPEHYFEELAANIQSRIAVEAIINIEESAFTAPEGYFDNLEQQIKSRILIEEALGEPAEHFTVPGDYFNRLNKNILDKTANAGNVNRSGVVRKIFVSTVFKYATAACFALVIGGGILLNELTNSPASAHKSSFLHKELLDVPIDDIKNYLQLNVDAGDTQQTVISEGTNVNDKTLKEDLQNYVDSVQ